MSGAPQLITAAVAVDRMCAAAVCARKQTAALIDDRDAATFEARTALLGVVTGIRVSLCHLHDWDPLTHAGILGPAEALINHWWKRTIPADWTGTVPYELLLMQHMAELLVHSDYGNAQALARDIGAPTSTCHRVTTLPHKVKLDTLVHVVEHLGGNTAHFMTLWRYANPIPRKPGRPKGK